MININIFLTTWPQKRDNYKEIFERRQVYEMLKLITD